MLILLLLLGAGAAAVAAASSSSSSSSSSGGVGIGPSGPFAGPSSMPTPNLATSGQKFMDPWIMQQPTLWGSDAGGPIPEGREYLVRLPAVGVARVDAMIAKANGPAGATPTVGLEQLEAIGAVLNQRIDADAMKTKQGIYRLWDWMGEKAGGNLYALAIVSALKWITGKIDLGAYGSSARAHFAVTDAMAAIVSEYGRALKLGLPPPWHGFEVLPVDLARLADAFKQTTSSLGDFQESIKQVVGDISTSDAAITRLGLVADVFRLNVDRTLPMPEPARDAIRVWWTMLLSRIEDPTVKRVFSALHGGTWGAFNLASDEQVLAVAAPIAAEFGVPLRQLAIEMWERAPGWSGERAILNNVGYSPVTAAGPGSGGSPNTPTNAVQVQWAQLAKLGIEIAKAIKGGAALPTPGPSLPEGLMVRVILPR